MSAAEADAMMGAFRQAMAHQAQTTAAAHWQKTTKKQVGKQKTERALARGLRVQRRKTARMEVKRRLEHYGADLYDEIVELEEDITEDAELLSSGMIAGKQSMALEQSVKEKRVKLHKLVEQGQE